MKSNVMRGLQRHTSRVAMKLHLSNVDLSKYSCTFAQIMGSFENNLNNSNNFQENSIYF